MAERLVLVLDGQGGGMGAQLIRQLLPGLPEDCRLLCVGTNALATGAMLKAGAPKGATGENAVIYNAARANVILGPIGLILANGILGEVSPAMAAAVSGATCPKVLVPSNACGVIITGVQEQKLDEHIRLAVVRALELLAQHP